MNVMVTAHLKQNYESWKQIFDDDTGRAAFCDESRTMVGKVDDKTALIVLFEVDREKMATRLSSPEFVDLVKDHVIDHDVYTLQEMSLFSG
jgi:hypothetical protein